MLQRLLVVALFVVALTACGPDDPPAAPAQQPSQIQPVQPAKPVHPGSYCSQPGQRGATDDGTPMVCATSDTDERNRWRRAATLAATKGS